MAIELRQLVDVVGRIEQPLYDRILIVLTVVAPLAIVLLSKWQASLERWYLTDEAYETREFLAAFQAAAEQWIAEGEAQASQLILIADPACPCTGPTRMKLLVAHSQSRRDELTIREWSLNDLRANRNPWSAKMLATLPATPTLLVTEGKKLLYAGPVNSGDFCTSAVNEVLGLAFLEGDRASPFVNWLSRGCYCKPPETTT